MAVERPLNESLNLPLTLAEWRTYEDGRGLWESFRSRFHAVGLELWVHAYYSTAKAPLNVNSPRQNGYLFAHTLRQDVKNVRIGFLGYLRIFQYKNTLFRPARTSEGQDIRLRVIVVNGEGQDHLRILRRLATGSVSLISGNHTLPLLREVELEHAVFGVFPMVGSSMAESAAPWPRNSVQDILELIMQALEGLAFIHKMGIAHQDAFLDNFLVQWQPESLLTVDLFSSRPRVYLIDFEVAVEFPAFTPPEQRICHGLPVGGSFPNKDEYGRPSPPDVLEGQGYDPFRLDVWQLTHDVIFRKFVVGDAEIDGLLKALCTDNADQRISAEAALGKMTLAVESAPRSCLKAPAVWK
ncbi:hypothetical protein VKT23_012855 [Stygiomarasmius scandens]|uniref:Protein kinase domain-containing protein n=1 Tax=Marasmiellus scandens TaxID=2682957 RepID=A0ABR1J5T3_9AGAR